LSKVLTLNTSTNKGARSDIFEPCIPSGKYRLAFDYFETAKMFNHDKLVLSFKVIDFGDAFETPLKRFYNVDHLKGKPQKNGNFKATKGGDFMIEYLTVFPNYVPSRLDRINMEVFKDKVIIGKVKTVTKNNRQRQLPEPMQYSVIEQLIGLGDH